MALKSLSEPDVNEAADMREVRELVQAAHDLIESVVLESVAGLEQPDPVIDRILPEAAEDSKSGPGRTCPAPTGL